MIIISHMKPDDVVFALFELFLVALAFKAAGYEYGVARRKDGLAKAVARGEESWQLFVATWSILSVLVSVIASSYARLTEEGLSVCTSMLNISLLGFLCFRSTWFRNKAVGVWAKLKKAPENH